MSLFHHPLLRTASGSFPKYELFPENCNLQLHEHHSEFRKDLMLVLAEHYTCIYNIYDYDERMPKVFDYILDIGKCFNYTESNNFSFVLPGKALCKN